MDAFDLIQQKLRAASCVYEILDHAPVYTMEDVARELSIPEESQVKTMVVRLRTETGQEPLLCGIGPKARLDLKGVAAHLGIPRARLSLMTPEETEAALKMPRGAIGLIAPDTSPRVLIDRKFEGCPVLSCGMGRHDRTLKISWAELQKLGVFESSKIARAEV